MRNISQEELKKILKEHELWLKREGGKCADLSDVDLRCADLTYANLTSIKPNTDSEYVINVSTNEIPIYVEYRPNASVMYWYCKDQIICPADMSNAFEGLTSL